MLCFDALPISCIKNHNYEVVSLQKSDLFLTKNSPKANNSSGGFYNFVQAPYVPQQPRPGSLEASSLEIGIFLNGDLQRKSYSFKFRHIPEVTELQDLLKELSKKFSLAKTLYLFDSNGRNVTDVGQIKSGSNYFCSSSKYFSPSDKNFESKNKLSSLSEDQVMILQHLQTFQDFS